MCPAKYISVLNRFLPLHCLLESSHQFKPVGTTVIPILQMGKLRHRQVEESVQDKLRRMEWPRLKVKFDSLQSLHS